MILLWWYWIRKKACAKTLWKLNHHTNVYFYSMSRYILFIKWESLTNWKLKIYCDIGQTLIKWCKLEVGQVGFQLVIGCCLLELSIRFAGVECHLPLEVKCLKYGLRRLFNAHFFFFTHWNKTLLIFTCSFDEIEIKFQK